MPVTLDATVGGTQSNALADDVEGDAYFSTRLYSTAWTSLTGAGGLDTKRVALITATRRFESFPWAGVRATTAQRLSWGRVGVEDRDGYLIGSTVIPLDVKEALFEHAHDLLVINADPGATDALAKFSRLKVGALEIELRPDAPRTLDVLRDVVWRKLAPYLVDESSSFGRG